MNWIESSEGKDPNRIGPLPLCEGLSLNFIVDNNEGYPWEISCEMKGGMADALEEKGLDTERISFCIRLSHENLTTLAETLAELIEGEPFKFYSKSVNETAED